MFQWGGGGGGGGGGGCFLGGGGGGGGGGGRFNFYIKNKLKSEIFTNKKVKIFSQQNHIFPLNAKIFFSVITNNSNWEILTKNLVTFKR